MPAKAAVQIRERAVGIFGSGNCVVPPDLRWVLWQLTLQRRNSPYTRFYFIHETFCASIFSTKVLQLRSNLQPLIDLG